MPLCRSQRATEAVLWKWVRRHAPPGQRIENHVGAGTPDAFVVVEGCTVWLELKTAARPKRETTRLQLRVEPSQVSWFERYRPRHGYFLVQVGYGADALRYLVHGEFARCLHETRITEAQLADISTGPALSARDRIDTALRDYAGM